jgi:hypothetical protein
MIRRAMPNIRRVRMKHIGSRAKLLACAEDLGRSPDQRHPGCHYKFPVVFHRGVSTIVSPPGLSSQP